MRMTIELFSLFFLQASVTCVVAGALVWALLQAALRIWPARALRRGVWLLAQIAVAATFALALLPHAREVSVLLTIALIRAGQPPSAGRRAPPQLAAALEPSAIAGTADAGKERNWLAALAQAWLAVCGAGLLVASTRWLWARGRLRAVLAAARPLEADALAAHAGFGDEPVRQLRDEGLRVLETGAAVSPMLAGLLRPRLLLPMHLRTFSAEQQQVIIAHELTHWRRRGGLWLQASLLLQTMFWFNPAVRAHAKRLSWAQELSGDQRVLDGRPQRQRQQYAAALVSQLKVQRRAMGTPALALGCGASDATLSARVRLIRQNGMAPLGLLGKSAPMAMLLALLIASALRQPAFAWGVEPPSLMDEVVETVLPMQRDLPEWQFPLDRVRVSSFYGVPRKTKTRTHHGVDFSAPMGTPVLATAPGTVIASTDRYDGGVKYGKVVLIEHEGGLRSMYAHLDSRHVKVGEAVDAGQVIALSGATGRSTGPHLHLEAFQGDQRIDPQRLLPMLEHNALSSAIKSRDAPMLAAKSARLANAAHTGRSSRAAKSTHVAKSSHAGKATHAAKSSRGAKRTA